MFGRFFGRERTQGEEERTIQRVVYREFEHGVNEPAIQLAFRAAQEEKRKKNLRIRNFHILNIIGNAAREMSTVVSYEMYGGREATRSFIENEINKLRNELTDSERAR